MNAVRSNSSRPLTAATGESVQVAPASTANLAAGDGAAAAPAAAGVQPQIEPGRAGGRIRPHSKLPKLEAVTVLAQLHSYLQTQKESIHAKEFTTQNPPKFS